MSLPATGSRAAQSAQALDVENPTDRTHHDYRGIPSNPRAIGRYDHVVGPALRWKP